MSLKERTINVDIMTKEYTKLKYKQGESGQNINIKLFKNGKQLDLIGLTVNAFFKKTNGEILEKSATFNDNVATITLSKQILNIAGKIKTELYITKGEELVISFTIIIDVEESINASSAVEEKEEWDSIKDLLIKSNNLAMIDDNNVSNKTTSSSYKINSQLEDIKNDYNSQIKENMNELQSEINSLVLESGGDSNLEIVQARNNEDVLNDRLNNIEKGYNIEKLFEKTYDTIYEYNGYTFDSNSIATNKRVIMPSKYAIPANHYIDSIKFVSEKEKTFNVEVFTSDGTTLTKVFSKTVTSTIGQNIVKINQQYDSVAHIAFSSSGSDEIPIGYANLNKSDIYYLPLTDENSYTFAYLSSSWFKITPCFSIVSYAVKDVIESIKSKPSNYVTVGKDKCDFTDIQEALDNINDSEYNHYTIFVYPGTYGQVTMRNKKRYVSIIGADKRGCIIKTNTGLYADAPMELWMDGMLKNLTVISDNTELPSGDYSGQKGGYALHIDFGQSNLYVEDCILISKNAPAVGMGLFENDDVKFKNCDIYGLQENVFSNFNQGAFYCHSNNTRDIPNENLTIENCYIYNKNSDKVALFQNIGVNSIVSLNSINTLYYSEQAKGERETTTSNSISKQGVMMEGYRFAEMLQDKSYGNNVSILNKFNS